MPQMSPLMWELLFCANLFSFIVMMNKVFYLIQPKSNNLIKSSLYNKMKLLW